MEEKLGFKLPDYIAQELEEYLLDVRNGKKRTCKWQNIRTLLRVAMLNNRLTCEQIKIIEKVYGNIC